MFPLVTLVKSPEEGIFSKHFSSGLQAVRISEELWLLSERLNAKSDDLSDSVRVLGAVSAGGK